MSSAEMSFISFFLFVFFFLSLAGTSDVTFDAPSPLSLLLLLLLSSSEEEEADARTTTTEEETFLLLLLLLLLLLFFPNGAVDEPRGDPPRNAWWWCLWTNLPEFWEVDEEGRLLVAPNNVDVAATTIANLSVICLSVCLSVCECEQSAWDVQ